MRLVGLLGVVFILGISGPAATAQTLLNHVSHDVVLRVQARFIEAYRAGGMMEVVSDIRHCYAATTSQRSVANETAVASCLLYDYSAFLLNKGMMKAFVAEGMPGAAQDPTPGTPMAYLTASAFTARLDIYAGIPFGSNTEAFGPYFGNAPTEITEAFARSQK